MFAICFHKITKVCSYLNIVAYLDRNIIRIYKLSRYAIFHIVELVDLQGLGGFHFRQKSEIILFWSRCDCLPGWNGTHCEIKTSVNASCMPGYEGSDCRLVLCDHGYAVPENGTFMGHNYR